MSRAIILAWAAAAPIALAAPADAQSLFGQPLAEEAQPAAPAARKPKPKPRGPTPARSLAISNASANTLTSLEISGEGKSARLPKTLASQARATLKLPAFKSCVVSVSAAFEGAGEAEASDYDICREKSIRFTD